MINARDITNFNRSKEELEELLLFCIIVAGKTASIQSKKLELFLKNDLLNLAPFELIRYYLKQGILLSKIQEAKLGQYTKINKAFSEVINLDVFKCTIQELESITGIGPKTARFYLLHSRKNQSIAVLDTHILKWLNHELGLVVPKATPNGKKYFELEQQFLNYCQLHDKNPATLDLEIWNKYSRK